MEIYIQEKSNTNCEIAPKKKTNNTDTNFAATLNNVADNNFKNNELSETGNRIAPLNKNKNATNGSTGISVIDNLPEKDKLAVKSALNDVNDILSLNPYNYFKADSTLDIREILQGFVGHGKLSLHNLTQLKKAIDLLHEKGIIDEDSYIYFLQWLMIQIQNLKLQEIPEKISIDIIDAIKKTSCGKI